MVANQLTWRSSADLHEQTESHLKELQLRVGDQCTYVAPTPDLIEKVTLLAKAQLGKLDLASTAGSREAAGAVLSRAPWTIKVMAQERG